MNINSHVNKILVVLLFGTLISACGLERSLENEEDSVDEKVELRFAWWGDEDRHTATIKSINKYMDLHPDIVIKPEYSGYAGYNQKIATQLAAGTAPDIMQLDYFYMAELAAQEDRFINFSEHKKSIDISTIDEKYLKDFSEVNNKLIGLPTGINSVIFFGNKKMLEQHNVTIKDNYSWERLVEDGKKVHQENPSHYLLHMGPGEMSLLMAYYIQQETGKNFIENDYSLGFDKKLLIEAFTYMKSLWDEGVVPDISEYATIRGKLEQHPKWLNGDLGLVLMSASGIHFFENSSNSLIPMLPPVKERAKETGIRTQPSQVFTVSTNSKEAEEAIKFINWLLNDREAIKLLGSVRGIQPTKRGQEILTDANQIDPLIEEAFHLGAENKGTNINTISLNTEVNKIYIDIVEQIGYERITPEEGAEQLIKQLNEFLEEIKPLD